MKKRGSVTIFICLIFICISALICGLLESARTSSSRLYLQMAGDSAIDSLFSRYHRELWENYKILALESDSDENIEELLFEYMKPYVDNSGMYKISYPKIDINKKVNLYDNGGMYLEQEIVDYMGLGVFESFFEGSPEDLWKNIEDAESMKEITSDYGLSSREAVEVEKSLKRISENITEQENIKSLMKSALDRRDTGGISSQADNLKKTLEKIPELIEDYEKKADNMSTRLGEIETENAENMGKLSESNRAYMESEISKFKEYVDKDSERRTQVSALTGISEEGKTAIENLYQDIENLQALIDEYDDEDDEPDDALEEAWNAVSEDINSLPEMKLDFKFGIADEEKEGLLKNLKNLISEGILSLVIPEGREVSSKTVDTSALPSGSPTEGYSGRDLLQRLLVNEYMGMYFADFTDNIDNPLSYELEYIINGKSSDRENLESAVLQVLAIREGLNYMHIISDASKMQRADELAVTISGAMCLPQISFLIKFLIISVWASVESAGDVKCLLSGEKVPLFKSGEDWRTDLDSMFELLDKKKLEDKPGNDKGLNYEQYLKLILYVGDSVKRNFRMMDIMQQNIGVNQGDFLIRDMVYGLDASIACGGKRLFSEISAFSDELGELDSHYDLKVRVEKIY